MDPFVLLDDALAGRATLMTDLARVDSVTLGTIDASLDAGWREGLHAFAWLPYDMGEAALGIGGDARGALFWFADRSEVDAEEFLPHSPAWLTGTAHDVDRAQFSAGIEAVKEAIASGETYQVNYTHRILSRAVGDPRALYRRLRSRQPVSFGVLARLPEPAAPWTLSLSPELFINVEGSHAVSKPMKGTAPVTEHPSTLSRDPKNRAENLMIVDLLRNDLSRVAVPGSVDVPMLFEVERVGRLWQMTSTVRAELVPGTTPGHLLAATFPCGSITGAPKIASMHLIRALERDRRGLYTGSLGVIAPHDGPLGWHMTLSIAIRTVEIDGNTARLGIGSGVVADSTADAEWAECRAKAAFAGSLLPTVHLREAIRVVDGVAPLADRHQERLSRSAAALGLPPATGVVHDAVRDAPSRGGWRLSVDLAPDGVVTVGVSPLEAVATPVRLILCGEPWEPTPLAGFKTTDRSHYDRALAAAAERGAFDAIGFDSGGRVLEGARTSVFALLDGRWVTPPLTLGILDGVQRAAVLADPALIGADEIDEAEFTVDRLLGAERLIVTNGLRGCLEATLETTE
ncbi:chorismate-binding protein [Tessaracoccus sp. MC1865]|uniref:bifunctional chorismate-binding protein/class IV aminotransferase n=1 Tax=Tessaracoccus sp. MC1865 TaxID=2760310 RepID=UPI0016025D7D|nr:bifunctional anthranilate synthase component I family protein/class IV aminotransferase [Tessaracoccus sp. MC1865]MBB1484877.1 chorismate-binding protein [Tessaracoccus sp. MC1865]QTO38722.1 chorismate-binding protein [Tessaracoccus sp. MC1865]